MAEMTKFSILFGKTSTIQWRSGADLDPDVLYAVISNQPIPNRLLFL
ncbi:MAG: hypothetical protein KME52_08700 [Desmonostoc geniculatum HA4340-LM1]|jgi:hypothetical protein|nr:hypothetical protein [Desmonostoc geniculatum HA4340-LM1]